MGTSWWAAFRGDVWVGLPSWLAAGAKLLPGNLPGRNSAGPSKKKLCTLLDLCVSSLRRGHANLLCIVPILTDDPRRESENTEPKSRWTTGTQLRKTQSQPKLRRLPGSFPEISRKLPRHRLGRLYTVWAGCTQSGPTVRSLGRLYTVWADCRFF